MKTYIELLEATRDELIRLNKYGRKGYICIVFSDIAKVNHIKGIKAGDFDSTVANDFDIEYIRQCIFSEYIRIYYSELKDWIVKIGKQYKSNYEYNKGWVTRYRSTHTSVPISEKIEQLNIYIEELKTK